LKREDKWTLLFLAILIAILNIGGSIYVSLPLRLIFSGSLGSLLILLIMYYLFLKPRIRRS